MSHGNTKCTDKISSFGLNGSMEFVLSTKMFDLAPLSLIKIKLSW